ncbi:MAG: multi antimicrobial extrusion protein MatE [Hyphomicrobiales bacterium]|nr:MAG: multi antimicrobial extrusion protein MatE [Hyphomicrobiales bacterium]
MQINLSHSIGSKLPKKLACHAQPWLEQADAILDGTDDDAVSKRMALLVFAIRVFSAAIAFLSQVLLARWMGDFEYGIFVGVWVVIVILGTVTCIGLPTAVLRFIGKYRESGDDELLRGTIVGSVSFAFLSSTVIAVLGGVFIYNFQDSMTDYYVVPIVLAVICLPMLALQEVQDGVCRAFDWPGTALVPTFVIRPIMILIFMLIALAIGFEASAVTAMGVTIIATYLASTGQFMALLSKLKSAVPKGPMTFRMKEWALVALPIFLIEGFYVLLTSVDILFVSALMRPEDVAVYFAAVKTLALVHFVYFAVRAATAHRFSAYLESGDRRRYEAYIAQTIRWIFWPSLFLAIMMMILGKYFLMLFGESFVSGAGLIWILGLGIVLRSTVGPAETVLTMSGEQNSCAMVYVGTLLVNIVLNWSLIPMYGLYGAAIATTCALAFESMLLYAVAKRKLGLHIFIIPQRKSSVGDGEEVTVK